MSEAENLLNQISDGGPEIATADPTTEEHIVIDSNRNVYVPEALRRIAVQYDHNIETVTFDCPRYWDGIDMSKMKVYINYRRPDGKVGSYHAEPVTIDDADTNIMHFDWVISRNVTEAKGILLFLVCINTVDEDGDEICHWNSELNRQMTVSEGLEADTEIEGMYPDIITQLLIRMDNVEEDNAATRDYIDEGLRTEVNSVVQGMVEGGVFVGVDLSDYATKEQLDDKSNELNDKIYQTAEDITAINTRLDTDEQSITNISDVVSDLNTDMAGVLDRLNAMTDYIVEYGTKPAQCYSEMWEYELWNSGKAMLQTQILVEANGSTLNGGNQIRASMPQEGLPMVSNKPIYVYLSSWVDQDITPFPITSNYEMTYDKTNNSILIEAENNSSFEEGQSILVNVCIVGHWK